jgi:hypothetical protein
MQSDRDTPQPTGQHHGRTGESPKTNNDIRLIGADEAQTK